MLRYIFTGCFCVISLATYAQSESWRERLQDKYRVDLEKQRQAEAIATKQQLSPTVACPKPTATPVTREQNLLAAIENCKKREQDCVERIAFYKNNPQTDRADAWLAKYEQSRATIQRERTQLEDALAKVKSTAPTR